MYIRIKPRKNLAIKVLIYINSRTKLTLINIWEFRNVWLTGLLGLIFGYKVSICFVLPKCQAISPHLVSSCFFFSKSKFMLLPGSPT